MRYLELPQLAPLNAVFSSIDADDGSRISGRAEAFSAKAAGADRKLWRHLEERFEMLWKETSSATSDASSNGMSSPQAPTGPMQYAVVNGIPLKHIYYLIATMNMVFSDYDFSDIDPKYFYRIADMSQAVRHVNSSIQNSGVTKSMSVLFEFSRNIWDSIDSAVNLKECDIYTFDPEDVDYTDNPFGNDSGCMYDFLNLTTE